MKDKICFSRTVAYLLGLAIILVGAFYVINYANTQRLGIDPKAGAAPKNCMYGAQVVTNTSSPYKWVSTTVASVVYKCIQTGSKNIGYRCKTDINGNINATGSIRDTTNCPLPSTARTECSYGGKKLTEYDPDYTLDANRCILTGASAWTGYYCSDSFVTTYNLTKCPRAAVARTGCYINGRLLAGQADYAVTAATRCITYKTKNTGWKCDLTTFNNTWDTATCPTTTARTECSYGGKKLTEYDPDYTLDANRCILTGASAWTGYYCSDSFVTTYNLTKCPRAAIARTECWFNNAALSSWKTKANTTRYTVEAATGCVMDNETSVNGGKDGYNNGLWCDQTNFKTKWDTVTCPL